MSDYHEKAVAFWVKSLYNDPNGSFQCFRLEHEELLFYPGLPGQKESYDYE